MPGGRQLLLQTSLYWRPFEVLGRGWKVLPEDSWSFGQWPLWVAPEALAGEASAGRAPSGLSCRPRWDRYLLLATWDQQQQTRHLAWVPEWEAFHLQLAMTSAFQRMMKTCFVGCFICFWTQTPCSSQKHAPNSNDGMLQFENNSRFRRWIG